MVARRYVQSPEPYNLNPRPLHDKRGERGDKRRREGLALVGPSFRLTSAHDLQEAQFQSLACLSHPPCFLSSQIMESRASSSEFEILCMTHERFVFV